MHIAALYDIHGNLPALEAVIKDLRKEKVDRIVVGGDIFPGPMSLEVLHALLDLEIPKHFIMGNGDREVLAHFRGEPSSLPANVLELIRHSADQLNEDEAQLVSGWEKTCSIHIPQIGDVLFCHATPRNDTEIFTRQTSEDRLLPVFKNVNASVVICGHTHMQFDRRIGNIRVVNAGSVGMPFQEAGAYWLLIDDKIQLRRTIYDLTEAAERIMKSNYPEARNFAERNVLNPPTENEMLEAFAKTELK